MSVPRMLVATVLAAGVVSSPTQQAAQAQGPAGEGQRRVPQARFYVDPVRGNDANPGTSADKAFRSIASGRDAVRKINREMTGDILVSLRGGDYVLTQPIVLDDRDSGSNGYKVIYTAEPGETPRLIGAQRITGWSLHDPARGIYAAHLGERTQTRQLFVNGVRARRATSVLGLPGVKKVPGGYTTSDLAMAGWKNIGDVELVYRQIWTSPRCGIERAELRASDVLLLMKQPGFSNASKKGITSVGTPWYIENAYELLDEPGEWYMDRTGAVSGVAHAVYYTPYAWENLANAEVLVPTAEQLIQAHGPSVERPIHDIQFHGIAFAYTTWLRPSSAFGVSDAQNNVMRESVSGLGESMIDGAAMSLRYARGVEISRCAFEHLGGIGVAMGPGSQQDVIEGCRFADVAANGIQIGDYRGFDSTSSENYCMPKDARLLLSENRITNNYFNRCGVEYRSATAIGISFPRDTVIAHNEIYNMPYSGIHLGWGWDRVPQTAQGNNLIEANRIQNTMVELADGGAIYTLGEGDAKYPPTRIRRNYAKQVRWGQGYYFDENSSYCQLSENVAEDVCDYNIKLNGKAHHISAVKTYSNRDRNTISKQVTNSTLEPAITIDDTTRVEAERIKAEAGLEPQFADVRPVFTDRALHEAEEAVLGAGVISSSGIGQKRFGYSGMGFATGFGKEKGSSITFKANVSSGGSYDAALRYAAPRPVVGVELTVNGAAAGSLALTQTEGEASWNRVVARVTLKEGDNLITITAREAAEQGADLDRLELTIAKQQ